MATRKAPTPDELLAAFKKPGSRLAEHQHNYDPTKHAIPEAVAVQNVKVLLRTTPANARRWLRELATDGPDSPIVIVQTADGGRVRRELCRNDDPERKGSHPYLWRHIGGPETPSPTLTFQGEFSPSPGYPYVASREYTFVVLRHVLEQYTRAAEAQWRQRAEKRAQDREVQAEKVEAAHGQSLAVIRALFAGAGISPDDPPLSELRTTYHQKSSWRTVSLTMELSDDAIDQLAEHLRRLGVNSSEEV